ncbi:MAG: YdcF family protein [Propionibacteriaceae bacterium]|nr:YdcF family protein [Propionibacteriaceae bacterium]
MEFGLAGAFAVLFVLSYVREPRSMRCAVFLFGAVVSLAINLVGIIGQAVADRSELAGAWLLLAVMLVMVATVLVVAVMLVLNGFTTMRLEGRRLSSLLSLLLGLAILVAVVAAVVAVFSAVANDSVPLVLGVLLTSLPISFLASGFLAYLLYSAVYQAITSRERRRVVAVVALGSGLIDGEVPPLLASRLNRARQAYQVAIAAGDRPVLVTSGGQGEDEPRSEAEAMAEYLSEHGVPEAAILTETESRTTEENLANTAVLLAERGIAGPVAVVTNNFHAFRAAMMMRKAGLAGYVLGAPTADYYWPSATIREYLAILRDHFWFVVISVGVLCLPAVWFAFSLLS